MVMNKIGFPKVFFVLIIFIFKFKNEFARLKDNSLKGGDPGAPSDTPTLL